MRKMPFQAAYIKVHERVLKQIYVGGCLRAYTECPSGWAEIKALMHVTSFHNVFPAGHRIQGLCEPSPSYDGLCGPLNMTVFEARSPREKEARQLGNVYKA